MLGSVVFFSDTTDNPYRVINASTMQNVFGGLLNTPPLTLMGAITYAKWHGWPFLVEKIDKQYMGAFEIVREGGRKARGDMVAWISLDRANDRIDNWGAGTASNSANYTKVQEFVDMVNRIAGNYSGRHVRKALIDAIIVGMAGTSLRDGGGVYFVPGTYRDELVQLANRVQALGMDLSMVDAEKTAEGLKSLRVQAERDLTRRAKEVVERLNELKKGKAETLENRAAEIRKLLMLADLYEDTLDCVLGDLRSTLQDARKALEVKMLQV